MKTCFVIIGFGVKTDPVTKRELNLDRTFENIIRPAIESIEDPKFECFRAIEKNKTGSIDKLMYHWILNADLVVADISTLNANVMYELGVRHALRPYSTIIISEEEQMKNKLPFDINHEVIHSYEHLGKDIGFSEVQRFQKKLRELALEIIRRQEPDSPVYTFIHELEPPKLKSKDVRVLSQQMSDILSDENQSLSHFLKEGERAKNEGNYRDACVFFNTALERNPNDSYTRQRLAVVTYKSKQPDPVNALLKAREILQPLNPAQSTDPETLGVSAAIEKRLYEITGDAGHLSRALEFNEKGFMIKQDYYNGINTAYLYIHKALLAQDKMEAIGNYARARDVWAKVLSLCQNTLSKGQLARFLNREIEYEEVREELPWIYATMAEAAFGLGDEAESAEYQNKFMSLPDTKFTQESFLEQKGKLESMLRTFRERHLR
jgi:tetratricopeptide (TPR) repeat protein